MAQTTKQQRRMAMGVVMTEGPASAAAKAAAPTVAASAVLFGVPLEHWILWLTLVWWVWLIVEKAVTAFRARKQRRRRRSDWQ